jgi:hypothetical protein
LDVIVLCTSHNEIRHDAGDLTDAKSMAKIAEVGAEDLVKDLI